jgi:excisionase family DNA binding protein
MASEGRALITEGFRADIEKERAWNVHEAAYYLGKMNYKTLQKYARDGKIPAHWWGGHWQFYKWELDEWRGSTVRSTTPPVSLTSQGEANG